MLHRIAVALLLAFCLAPAHASSYVIHDLSAILPTHPHTWDMSTTGELAGDRLSDDGKQHAFRWSRTEGLLDLGIYGGGRASGAESINATGWVAGYSDVQVTDSRGTRELSHAMLWKPDGTPLHLGTLPGAETSIALSINDSARSLGVSTFISYDDHGLPLYTRHTTIWNPDGSMEDLGTLFAGVPYAATMINNADTILGYSTAGSYTPWLRGATGAYTYLDTMGADYCSVDDLSNSGLVVGTLASPEPHEMRATVWGPDGAVLRRLGPLVGFSDTIGYGINTQGFVVGESNDLLADQIRATLWTPDGIPIDLGSLPGFEISRAWGISDDGWIVGEVGTYGDWRTVLWEPVPEPASCVPLGMGSLLLLGRCVLSPRRFRRRL